MNLQVKESYPLFKFDFRDWFRGWLELDSPVPEPHEDEVEMPTSPEYSAFGEVHAPWDEIDRGLREERLRR